MILRLGIYIGIGVILHMIVIGPYFDWSSTQTWLWLFAWPIVGFFYLLVFVVAYVIITFAWEIFVYAVGGRQNDRRSR